MIIGWDARRESGRLSLLIDEEKATTDPSERFEKNKRKKNKKEKEEGTGIYTVLPRKLYCCWRSDNGRAIIIDSSSATFSLLLLLFFPPE